MAIPRPLSGSIRGKTIVLEDDPGLPEGQAVTVTLTPRPPSDAVTRERLLRAAGAWADDAEGLDEFLEWTRQQRKIDQPDLDE